MSAPHHDPPEHPKNPKTEKPNRILLGYQKALKSLQNMNSLVFQVKNYILKAQREIKKKRD
jgi:hypothetical protein